MLKRILTLLFFAPLITDAQELKPLIQTPYQDFVTDIINLEDDEILVTHFITAIDLSTFEYLNNDSIDGISFSTLQVYDKNGKHINSLTLPDTDTSIFWSSNMIKLKGGNFCIAGQSLNTIANTSQLFFAIINADITSVESIHIIPSTVEVNVNRVFELSNGNLAFLCNDGYGKIKQYKKDASFVSEFNIENNSCSPGRSIFPNVNYFLDDEFKVICDNPTTDHLISLDSTYQLASYNINTVAGMNNRSIHYFSDAATVYNGNLLVNAGASHSNSSDIYPLILQINSSNQISTFFSDTTQAINVNSFLHLANLKYYDEDYIYTVFSDTRQTSGTYTIYCLDAQGNLRWKKQINSTTGFSTGFRNGNILQTIATSDKGFMFTVLADDNFGNQDIYYYKVDSTGSFKDFITGIFSSGPKLEVYDFFLYPNPVLEKLNIETALKGKFTLNVFDVLGKKVKSYAFENNASLNLENLNEGNYFYTITNETGEIVQKSKFLKK